MCGKKCSFSKPVGFTVTRNNRLRRLFRRNKRSRGVFQTRARSLLELQPTKHCWNGLKHESMWVKWQFQSVWDGKLRQKRSVTVLAKRRWLKARHVVGHGTLSIECNDASLFNRTHSEYWVLPEVACLGRVEDFERSKGPMTDVHQTKLEMKRARCSESVWLGYRRVTASLGSLFHFFRKWQKQLWIFQNKK